MQLAINAIILVLAFTVVAKPIQFRKAVNRLIKKLRSATNGFEKVALLPNEFEEIQLLSDSENVELLTKFVACSSFILARLTCCQNRS
jgi:hypothetical protein